MDEQIREVIRKNLPLEVGETLQNELERLHTLEGEFKRLKEDYTNCDKDKRDFKAQLSRHADLDQRERELDAKDRELQELERNLKVQELEIKLKCEYEKSQFTKDVALGLVRNLEYRKTAYNGHSTPLMDNNGYVQNYTDSTNSDETTKVE